MERIHIKDITEESKIKLKGFVQAIRDQGKIVFIEVRDKTGEIQVVCQDKESIRILQELALESVVSITGLALPRKDKEGQFEIQLETIEILSSANEGLPIPVIEKAGETTRRKRMDYRWIDLRKSQNRFIFSVWTFMEKAFYDYAIDKGLYCIHTPNLMSSPSESRSELFELEYFGKKVYLAQSPQFYKQMAQSAGFEGYFEVGPVFRANPSFTSRHDTEFTGYDIELSYIESYQEIIEFEKGMVVAICKELEARLGEAKKEFYPEAPDLSSPKFAEVTLEEAKEMLAKLGVESREDGDLAPEEERELGKYFLEKDGAQFIFIKQYPTTIRPFYHMRDGDMTYSFDLLFLGLEITTGAQREHRYDILLEQAKSKGHDIAELQHYLDFFKYGCPPHGGFGFGPSRFVMQYLGLENVRDATFLYRGPKRLDP